MRARVQIVVVNYRTPELSVDCLRSLAPELREFSETRATVVDNASGDGSARIIRQAIANHGWESWADVLPLQENGGFSRGNNAVLRRCFGATLGDAAVPDFVWLLNPDTRPRPGALRALLRFMQLHPEVGIAGSRLEDPDGSPQRSAFRFHSVLGELSNGLRWRITSKLLAPWDVAPRPPAHATRTDWVAGASMLIRREVLETVGWLDEGYFLYYEEVDYCLRAKKAGWPCWYVPNSRVVHLVGRSTGVTDPGRMRERLPRYWFDSRRRYFIKNYGWRYAALADVAHMAGLASRHVRDVMKGRPHDAPARMVLDLIRHGALLNWSELSAKHAHLRRAA